MPNIPNSTHAALLGWLTSHQTQWEDHLAALGISQAQYDEFAAMIDVTKDAVRKASFMRMAAEGATRAQNLALSQVKDKASDLIMLIKGQIATTQNESLWPLAGLTPPSRRSKAPAPNAPTSAHARVDASGSIVVTWKARQPRGLTGTVYAISRALDGNPHETLLDVVGGKEFIDDAIPFGTRSVRYQIRARRLQRESETAAQAMVQLGRVTIQSNAVAKIAA